MKKKILTYTMAAGLMISVVGGVALTAHAEQTAIETTAASKQEVGPGVTPDAAKLREQILLWGQVTKVDKEYNRIYLNNQSQGFPQGEVIITISPDQTRVLDAVEGLPASLDDMVVGEVVYAYIEPVMTLSIPAITSASMVICKIPADFRVPEYLKVREMEKQENGSYLLKGTNDSAYTIPADCVIIPYLTRNMVRLDDVTAGKQCLVWTGIDNRTTKIVLFAE